jgi:response regulator of citrate/malate metabolism
VINGLHAMLAEHQDLKLAFTTTKSPQLLDYLEQHQPNVIWMDIQMTGMNGVDLCKSIHKPLAKVQESLCSAGGEEEAIWPGENSPFGKPICLILVFRVYFFWIKAYFWYIVIE